MDSFQWKAFADFREAFKAQVGLWLGELRAADALPLLAQLQKEAADADGTPPYPLENQLVYNTALDEIGEQDRIKLIVIGDNPGKAEQLAKNRRYLVGQAGKLAESFFKNNAEFGTDFRKNVVILNKTPLHSAKTKELLRIKSGAEKAGGSAGRAVLKVLDESQKWMAEQTAALHIKLNAQNVGAGGSCALWLVGYSELKPKGVFCAYKDYLKKSYAAAPECWGKVLVFQHFSMNRFSIDLNEFRAASPDLPLAQALQALGTKHKDEIF